ncbi:MAG: substrate-binding protein [Candidatus Eremiobacteraeota bacterium]|nr:substrate-binding protein [Candidatus Eremiobacteraeota bacterium]MBV8353948.1 substrate-binding protein [Candidatus Eremiobacteraeota bacterium]
MPFDRSVFLKSTGGAVAGAVMTSSGLNVALAQNYPSLGTFPDGTKGDTVFVGCVADLTGPYSADGEDQRKGFELAIEQLNAGTGVMGKIPTLAGKKGLLGKKVIYKISDGETKPDPAVQRATEFIANDKAIMYTGCVASSETIALEKLAQQQKVIYMTGASGSNDTTGKDCQRYGFRSQPSAYMVSKALAPILGKELGKKRRAVYLVPDYSYGRSLYESMKEFTEKLGWTTVSSVFSPFPTSDFSPYLTNVANANADTFVNITFGTEAIASTKQAAQFGTLKKMELVVPNISTYMPDGVGADLMQGVYGTMDWTWRLQERYPLSKMFVDDFRKKFGGTYPRWTAHISYAQLAIWADAVTRAKTFYPVEVIKTLEAGKPVDLMLGRVFYRAGDHQQVRPVPVLVGKKPGEMANKEDFFKIVSVVPGEDLVPPLDVTGCKMPAYS